jgi:hypothetical protein
MADQGRKFYDTDLGPAIAKIASSFEQAASEVAHFLYPRTGANPDALDALFKAKGHVEKVRFDLEQKHIDRSLEKFIDRMTQDAQLAFIDRIMTGQRQTDFSALPVVNSLFGSLDNCRSRWKPGALASGIQPK